jgi:VWFA-related protein
VIRTIRLSLLWMGVAASTMLAAQQSAVQPPTFRAGVEAVEVDVIVTDDQGRHVRDLRQEDFEVLEGGRPQKLTTFTHVELPSARFDQPTFSTEPIEPDVVSNEQPFDGRIYVMLIDDLSIGFPRAAQARQVAGDFVRKHFGANDLMAVVHTANTADASQDFTSSKRRLLAAVEKTRGCKLPPVTATINSSLSVDGLGRVVLNETLSRRTDNACDPDISRGVPRTLRALRAVAEGLAGVQGRRKAILLVGEGIYLGIGDADPTGAADEARAETRAALEALVRANTSIYAIDPGGLRSGGAEDIVIGRIPLDAGGAPDVDQYNRLMPLGEQIAEQNALRQLSGETGGFAVLNMNDYGDAFSRVVADNSSYYLLGFQPGDAKQDGKFHDIDVRVKRPGVHVRARRGYYEPRAGRTNATRSGPDWKTSPELRDALNSLLPVSGVGLRVASTAFKSGPDASVLITTEVPARHLNADGGPLELAYFAVDTEGKLHGGVTDKVTMKFQPEMRAHVERRGLRVLKRMKLPPGRYQLHLAARNADGTVGSVVADLDIPIYDTLALAMSDILLTSVENSSIPTLRPDEEARKLLPAPPIAQRIFPQNDTIALFAEIYDDGRAVPHKVRITTTLRADGGTQVFQNGEERDSKDLGGKRGGFGYSANVPLRGLPPGRYVLSVEAQSRMTEPAPAARHIRITVLPAAEYEQRR